MAKRFIMHSSAVKRWRVIYVNPDESIRLDKEGGPLKRKFGY